MPKSMDFYAIYIHFLQTNLEPDCRLDIDFKVMLRNPLCVLNHMIESVS